MVHHPSGVTVEIPGMEESNLGRSCEEHTSCDSVLVLDSVLCLRSIQIINGKYFCILIVLFLFFILHIFIMIPVDEGNKETAIGAFWVTDGIDCCLVGFLPRHLVPHRRQFDGKLTQVVEFLKNFKSPGARRRSYVNHGVCMAAIIDSNS